MGVTWENGKNPTLSHRHIKRGGKAQWNENVCLALSQAVLPDVLVGIFGKLDHIQIQIIDILLFELRFDVRIIPDIVNLPLAVLDRFVCMLQGVVVIDFLESIG